MANAKKLEEGTTSAIHQIEPVRLDSADSSAMGCWLLGYWLLGDIWGGS
ncbi:MAG: hypothetical protein AAF587_42580 [Bacteroidota bacterium]